MIVLDANILIRAVLGRRVRQILDTYSALGLRFLTPDIAFQDAEKYLPALLRKHAVQQTSVSALLEYLEQIMEIVDRDLYVAFEKEARDRLRARDETDWPVLATALALSCAVWTEDTDFFGTGVSVWTTNRVEIFLKSQVSSQKAEPDE